MPGSARHVSLHRPDRQRGARSVFATGDGSTTSFTLQRSLGAFSEPVSYVTALSAVYSNAAPVSGYQLVAPNTISFATPPASGATLSADLTYAFLCRFTDDQQDFENVMNGLWSLSTLKFRSIRP